MTKNYAFLFLFLISIANAESPVPPGARLVKLTSGLTQPEGPLWKDSVLLFSDIEENLIYKWSPADSACTPYLQPSQNSNGLALDLQGRLILTQMGLRCVSRQEADSTITVLTATFRGEKYNSPNDIVVKSDGAIFFTDPDNNVPPDQSVELPFKGVYRISPYGAVTLLDSTFNKPNGICFSPDEKMLYVNDSYLSRPKIYALDIVDDSLTSPKRLFYSIPANGWADGMKVDPIGNIYCTGPGGVWVISPQADSLDIIPMTTAPSNCAWGDADRKTLYITGGWGDNLYKIRLASVTGVTDRELTSPLGFQLFINYPNPFNPTTKISFRVAKKEHAKLSVYNLLGQQVAVLFNGLADGQKNYEVKFDANGQSSGVYFYKLATPSRTDVKKMVLMK